MGWIRRIDAIGWIAVACAAIAIVAAVVYFATDCLDAWAPNIATEAVSIAITVGLVGWLLKRAEHKRDEPRLRSSLFWLRFALQDFMTALRDDYIETFHAEAADLPGDDRAMIEEWAKQWGANEDAHRRPPIPAILPPLFSAGAKLSEALGRHAVPNGDVIPLLAGAGMDYFESFTRGQHLYVEVAQHSDDPAESARGAFLFVVVSARPVFEAYISESARLRSGRPKKRKTPVPIGTPVYYNPGPPENPPTG